MITNKEISLLKQHNIDISKITYKYQFSSTIIDKYDYITKYGSRKMNNFLQSINVKLLTLITNGLSTNIEIVSNDSKDKINLRYLYNNEYYTINISHTTIIFNSIDINNVHGLNKEIFELLEFNQNDMIESKNKYDKIVYMIEFGSFNINPILKSFKCQNLSNFDQTNYLFYQNLSKQQQLSKNNISFVHNKKQCINCYDRNYKMIYKIRLQGRNKWLITQNRNYGSINDFINFYQYIHNNIILPNLLISLHSDTNSLFSKLLGEIIEIINNKIKIDRYPYPSPSNKEFILKINHYLLTDFFINK